jgi:hypothetical protein
MIDGASLLLAIALTASGLHRCGEGRGYIYDRVGENSADVFNVRWGMLSVQSRTHANIGRSTDIGGPFQFCTNATFHCLASSSAFYNLIVPKTEAAGSWSFRGISCTTKVSDDRRIEGQCSSGLSYLYERGRGVTGYKWRYGGRENTYVLRGRCGLFSER